MNGWMTLKEACEYARCSRETLRTAVVEYQRSNGRTGLRGAQRKVGASWKFQAEDLDRWVRGESPARSKPRLVAS